MLRELGKWTSHEPIYIGDTTSHIDNAKLELIQMILIRSSYSKIFL